MSAVIGKTVPAVRYPWMFGRTFDLAFFFAPILVGIALYLLSKSVLAQGSPFWALAAASAFGAGPFHQGATWFAYFDRENRKHYVSSPGKSLIFVVAPALVVGLTILGIFKAFYLTVAIWMIWSLQHLVQQNVGILLLYHNQGQGEAIVPRPLEVRCQQAAAIMFSLIFFWRVMLEYRLANVMVPLIAILAIYTCILTIRYLANLNEQLKAGSYLNMPALLFWCFSMLCLFPIAFVGRTFEEGYTIPITVHWFQYIAVNLILVKNKYATERAKDLPVSHPLALFFFFCISMVAMVSALSLLKDFGVCHEAWQKVLLMGTIFGLGNVHYFLDAFLWRFREPYQRQAILPYLLLERKKKTLGTLVASNPGIS